MVATAAAPVKQSALDRAHAQHLRAFPESRLYQGQYGDPHYWFVGSSTGVGVYHVRLYDNGASSCDCPAGANGRACKHVAIARDVWAQDRAICRQTAIDYRPIRSLEDLFA